MGGHFFAEMIIVQVKRDSFLCYMWIVFCVHINTQKEAVSLMGKGLRDPFLVLNFRCDFSYVHT